MTRTSSPEQSLRRRLLFTVLGVVAPLTLGLSVILFATVQYTVWNRFDEDIVDLGHTLGELAEFEGRVLDFELGAHPAPPSRAEGRSTHYWIWDETGELRVSTLEGGLESLSVSLPPPSLDARPGMITSHGHLPSGEAVRVTEFRFTPSVDDEFTRDDPPAVISLVVAKETASTHDALTRIGTWFLGLGLITLGAASFVAWWAVGRGLEPVGSLGDAIARVDEHELEGRLDPRQVPVELRPIVVHTNTLLERLQRAFDKERRFTADVAHELRTPLSILRTEMELSLRREREPDEYKATLASGLRTVGELSDMVDNLLLLARSEVEPTTSRRRTTVELRDMVEQVWTRHQARATERELSFECTIDPAWTEETDSDKLRMIIANLLSNATEYTERGGWIRVETGTETAGATVLRVLDSGPLVAKADRERLFDRFWRADGARSEAGVHCGIGLSLVRSLAQQLGYEVRAEEHEGAMAFVLRRSARSS